MKMKAVIGFLILSALFALGWIVAYNNLAMMKVFAPATEQVRRETFENSKAYRDGMVQELRSMQFEYVLADDAHKAALANVIRHKIAGFPEAAIPYDLQQFIKELP
jgi:hypothetical protein